MSSDPAPGRGSTQRAHPRRRASTDAPSTVHLVILVLTLVGALFVDRPWCRYACPLGAANGIVARFSPVRLERSASACVDCNLCTRSCPMGLEVAKAKVITSADCIGCLECVEACPRDSALELRIGNPIAFPFGGKA